MIEKEIGFVLVESVKTDSGRLVGLNKQVDVYYDLIERCCNVDDSIGQPYCCVTTPQKNIAYPAILLLDLRVSGTPNAEPTIRRLMHLPNSSASVAFREI